MGENEILHSAETGIPHLAESIFPLSAMLSPMSSHQHDMATSPPFSCGFDTIFGPELIFWRGVTACQALLQAGANANDEGNTVLTIAEKPVHDDVVALLREYGVTCYDQPHLRGLD